MERELFPHHPCGGETSEAAAAAAAAADQQQQLSPNTLKVAATECLNSWISYLQIMNTMCSAGTRLASSLWQLSQQQNNIVMATQCRNNWQDLTQATAIASTTVKNHIAAAMHDMSIGDTFTESDAQRQIEHNQRIITENILTFINLQYQFSIASCEYFGSMAQCPSCQTTAGGVHQSECCMATIQQCFSNYYQSSDFSSSYSANTSPRFEDHHHHLQQQQQLPNRQTSPLLSDTRGSSPIRGTNNNSPGPGDVPLTTTKFLGGVLDTLRGPFPTPGALHTMKLPFPGRNTGQRSPLHFPLFPLMAGGHQMRRWSEVGTVSGVGGAETEEAAGTSEGSTARRWSMPYYYDNNAWAAETAAAAAASSSSSSHHQQRNSQIKLSVPSLLSSSAGYQQQQQHQERSRSTTPESVTSQQSSAALFHPCSSSSASTGASAAAAAAAATVLPNVEGLNEAIQLLSLRPGRSSIPSTTIPGHSYLPSSLSSQWGETQSHDERITQHRRLFPSQRGNWQSVDVPSGGGHSSSAGAAGTSLSEHFDIFPSSFTSRKSSSSTDSSSCLSIHSRSTASGSERGSTSDGSGGAGDAIRLHSNFYSMWSGSEHLPFIRLPESQEPIDDSDDNDDPPTERSEAFPKPT